jgi:hypothetical protein
LPKSISSRYDVGWRTPMKLTHSESAALIEELVRRAKQGNDKTVFGLLLLLERELHAGDGYDAEVRMGNAKGAGLGNQREPIVANLSRYVE